MGGPTEEEALAISPRQQSSWSLDPGARKGGSKRKGWILSPLFQRKLKEFPPLQGQAQKKGSSCALLFLSFPSSL